MSNELNNILALDTVVALSDAYDTKHGYEGNEEVADALGALYQLLGHMMASDVAQAPFQGPCEADLKAFIKKHSS